MVSTKEIERKQLLIANHMHEILSLLGEDIDREGLVKTPLRVSKVMQYHKRLLARPGRNTLFCII